MDELKRRLREQSTENLRRRLDKCKRCQDDPDFRRQALAAMAERGVRTTEEELLLTNALLGLDLVEELRRRLTEVELPGKCPHCGAETDRATLADATEAARPSEGDVTLCWECGEWSVFGEGLELAVPDDAMKLKIGFNPDCRRVRELWRSKRG